MKRNECPHLSADGTDNEEEWRCTMCGAVYRYVDDPQGPITLGDGRRVWRVRREIVTDAEQPEVPA